MGRRPQQRDRVTQKQAADRLDVSPKTIMRWVAAGLVKRGDDDLISYAEARAVAEARRAGTSVDSLKSGAATDSGARDRQRPAATSAVSLDEARARKEAALAELREMDLAEKRGEMVSATAVASHVRQQVSAARDRISGDLPDLAPRIVGAVVQSLGIAATDTAPAEHVVRVMLADAVRDCLASVADDALRYAHGAVDDDAPSEDATEPSA